MKTPPQKQRSAIQKGLLAWADESNLREFPWRNTTSTYEVLVAEVLLQQTLASKVVPVYEELLDRYPGPAEIADADSDEVTDLLEPLGFHNQRARALVENGRLIRDEGMPESVEDLKNNLNYVGDYAANATACFGYGERRPVVDTNVVRIYERLFDLNLNPQEEATWEFAESFLPQTEFVKYNLTLLDLGAKICTSTSPNCEECPLSNECEYYGRER